MVQAPAPVQDVDVDRLLQADREELARVAAEQMSTLAFNNNYVGFVNVPSVRLAEKLSQIAYPNLQAVYFTTSGAESNESAFKTARFYWKLQGQPDKVKIISRRWGYHGVTMAAASATGLPAYHRMFAPLVPNFVQAIRDPPPRGVAAITPGRGGGGGGVFAPPEYYGPKLRETANRHNVLLIA